MADRARSLLFGLLLIALALPGCRERSERTASDDAAPSAPGAAKRGELLVRELECSRCHAGTGAPAATRDKDCVGCHQSIVSGDFPVDPETLSHWQRRLRHFVALPSLAHVGKKLRRSWLERYLQQPHDLRPGLDETMPRLGLSRDQARDIATYLAPADTAMRGEPGNHERGRTALEQKGCTTCHRMGGVPVLAVRPFSPPMEAARLTQAIRLAPDLRHARARLLDGYLERWLTEPSAVDPRTLMPDIPLTPEEVRDIAAFLRSTPLAVDPSPSFQRLPVLQRKVTWGELKANVFRDTCWHCHSDPDYNLGDGGPGNTGGFGFPGKRIHLAEHEGLLAGYVNERGERKSLFLPEPPHGEGRLVQSLLARHAEQAGQPVPGIRGMPLGLPALSAENIQLVETWIAQGRSL